MKIKQDFYAIGYLDSPQGFSLVDTVEEFEGGLDGCTRFQTEEEAEQVLKAWKRGVSPFRYSPSSREKVVKVTVTIEGV